MEKGAKNTSLNLPKLHLGVAASRRYEQAEVGPAAESLPVTREHCVGPSPHTSCVQSILRE